MKKIRLLPAFVTLLAGAITSVAMYMTNQDLLMTLIMVVLVVFVFYFLGVLAMKIIIDNFDKEPEEEVSEEGQVLEKDNVDK